MLHGSSGGFRFPQRQGGWIQLAIAGISALLARKDKKDADRQAEADRARELSIEEGQLDLAKKADARSDALFNHYRDVYMPRESEFVADAFGNEISPARAEARATGDVRSALSTARDARDRRMRALGVDPGSGTALALDGQIGLEEARIEAGARTGAREATRDKNFARKATALGYANPSGAAGYAGEAMSATSAAGALAARRSSSSAEYAGQAAANYGASIGDLMDSGLAAWKNRKRRSDVDPYNVGWF